MQVSDSGLVEPIDAAAQGVVREHTGFYVGEAGRIFGRRFRRIPVLFDLSGTTAGMFKLRGRRGVIRYNPWIFAKYFDENLRDTVPHEVAHYVIHEVYGDRRVKPHGPEWQDLMARFGADAGVTFDLDLRGIPRRRQRTHPYRCDCRLHDLSSTRHNRVLRGRGRYQCVLCNGELVYAPEAT